MAKKAKAKKGSSHQFGVANLAKDLGIQVASVRVALRKNKIKKNEGVYGWDSRKDYDAVLKKIKSDEKAPPKKKAAKKAAKKEKEAEAE